MKPATLVVETLDGIDGVWLCADDNTSCTPLARFASETAARRFIELFALARSVSHAQGQSGI